MKVLHHRVDDLIGRTIRSISEANGLCLDLDDGTKILIYNNYVVGGIHTERFDSLLGRVISGADLTKEYFRIKLGGSRSIDIGLSDDDYRGPEAFQIRFPDGFLVVQQ